MTFTRKPSWSEALLGAINHALGYLNVRDAAVDDVAATAYTTAAVAATKTTALTGDHNDLTYTAAVAGDAGNDITVEYVDPGEISQALTVEAGAGSTVIVNLATDGDGLITTTAEDIRAAVMAEAAITVFCTVALAPGNTGAGVVTAMAATNLEGGVDAIPHSGVRAMLWDAESNEIGAANPLPVEVLNSAGSPANVSAVLPEKLAGENLTGDFLNTIPKWDKGNAVAGAASPSASVAYNAPAVLHGFMVNVAGAASSTVQAWDNPTAASGVLLTGPLPITSVGFIDCGDIPANLGITIKVTDSAAGASVVPIFKSIA